MTIKNALLVDIGGTKTEFEYRNIIVKYENINYSSFESILTNFLNDNSIKPDFFAIAAAGPIKEGICKLTNLSWIIDINKIHQTFFSYLSKNKIFLLNDLEASAWYPKDINDSQRKAHYAVISVGTGLGVAFALYNKWNNDYLIIPGEAGHTYRNIDNRETWEDILSGEGLVRMYNSLNKKENKITTTKELHILAAAQDPNAIKTINNFFYNLGIFSQNIALTIIPQKGIYLTGGIVNNFYYFINPSSLKDSFNESKKMQEILKDIPLYFLEGSAPLKGLKSFITYICN